MKNKGKINLIPIFVLVIFLALLIGAAFALRQWQKSRKMSDGLRLGEAAYKQQDWMEAATQFGYYLGGAQDDIEILSKYAECLTKARPTEPSRLMSAANAYRRIIRNDKTNAEAIEKASDIYIATGNSGEAELILADAIKLLPENETLHNKYALSLALQKKLDDLLKIKNENPDHLKSYYQFIAELCIADEKYSIAVDILKQVIEKYPEEIDAYQSLVNLILQKEYKENARQGVNKAILFKEIEPWLVQASQACPADPKLYLMLANIELWNENYNQVPANLNKALELASNDDFLIKIQIASFYSQLERSDPDNFKGMSDLAVNICINIVDNDPTNLRAWKSLIGFVRLKNNKQQLEELTDKALKSLDITSQWDFIPTAIENYASIGKNSKAIELINQVEKAEAMEAHVAYWKALIARNNNDNYEEISQLNKAILLGYDNTAIKIQLANAYRKNNDLSSAILNLRNVLEKNPNIRSVILDIATLYLQTQQYNDAILTAQKLLQNSENDTDAIAIVLQANIQIASNEQLKDPDSTLYANLLAEISKHIDKFQDQLIPQRLMFSLAIKAGKYEDAETIINQLRGDSTIDQKAVDNLQLSLNLNKSQYFNDLGNKAEAQRLQNETISILKRQLEDNPDNISLIISQAGILVNNKQYGEALSLIDNSLESVNNISDKRNLVFAKSDILLAEDRDKKADDPEKRALSVIENYLSENSQDIAAIRKTLYFKTIIGDTSKAKSAIEKIKQIESNDAGRIWKIELARLCLLQDPFNKADAQEAITVLKDVLAKNPYDQDCSVNLAQLYEKDSQLQLAANLWLEIHNRYLNNIQFADNAIRCLRRAGQTKKANELLQQMLSQVPDDPRLLGYEAIRLLEENNIDQAEYILEGIYNKSLATDMQILTLANIYYTKAGSLQEEFTSDKNKYYEKAIQLCDEILNDGTYNYEAFTIKVGALIRMDRHEEAKDICGKAISQNESSQSYLLRARFYFNINDIDAMLTDLDKACSFEDIKESDYSGIITLYTSINDTNNAVKYAKLALKQFPDNVILARQAISLFLFPPSKLSLNEKQLKSLDNKKQEELLDQQMKDLAKDGELLLDNTLAKHPSDLAIKILKSRFLIDSGTKPELSTARNLLSDVVADQPENINAWLLLSEVELKRLQYERAIDILNAALQYNPDNPDLTIRKAQAESQINPELARATLEKVSSLASTNADVGIRLASIYLTRNEPVQALKLLDTAEKLTDNISQLDTINILRILASYKQGNKEIISEINQILTDQPKNTDAFIAKVDMLIFDENWSAVSDTVSQWENINPDNIQSLLNVVSILLRFQDKENAVNLIFNITDKVIEKEPDNIAALQVQATISNINQDIQKAIERYKQILEYEPENTVAMNNMAWVLSEELNKPNEALKLAEKGLSINSNYADLNDTTGVIYFRLGNYNKSIEQLEKAISLYNTNDPELVNTFYHLGRSHYLAGNKVEADKLLQRAKDFNESTNTLSEKDKAELNELLNSAK